MLLHDKKLIFIHIPKTGGKSITQALQRYSGRVVVGESKDYEDQASKDLLIGNYDLSSPGPQALHHLTLSELVKYKYITKDQLKEYTIFSVVRNPYDRFLSAYNYHEMYKHFNIDNAIKYITSHVYEKNMSRLDNLRHFIPQSDFLIYKGKMYPKFIFRFETDLQYQCPKFIQKKLEYKQNDFFLGHVNETRYETHEHSKALINFVNDFYDRDFCYFNYNKITF